MVPLANNSYARWRVESGAVQALQDNAESPPENLLQAVWRHQRLRRDQLKLTDGRKLEVLHPGFLSVEGGPDFRGAILRAEDGTLLRGDIEVDLRPSGWKAHGHDKNPAFANVVLHVVWHAGSESAAKPPLLCLADVLDSSIGELSLWLGSEAERAWPEQLRGQCCAPLRELSEESFLNVLHQAAEVRLQAKGSQFHARAREAGWEQALWEGMFRALGYKNNVWPMQRLGELRERWSDAAQAVILRQARLLGLSGLLPADISAVPSGASGYLREVWDVWWRDRDLFSDAILPRAAWHLHGLRPSNHPQRRLALAAHWSESEKIGAKFEQWCAREIPPAHAPESLLEILQGQSDAFWEWHCTFNSKRFPKPQPLLGSTRATDLAINVVLPWLWVRAGESKNDQMQAKIWERYFRWPAAEDNAVLRTARERLLGGDRQRPLKTAAAQQGLLQIIRDFCQRSDSLCEGCQFPRVVRELSERHLPNTKVSADQST